MSEQQNVKQFTQLKHLVLASSLLSMVACGGGGVGGNAQAPDPTVAEKPIAYVKRPTPMMNGSPSSGDLRDPEAFIPGAHLIVKKTASLSSSEIDITSAIIAANGDVDVRDPAFSDDGTKLIFALHKQDDNVDPPETWDLYEYDFTQPISSNNPMPLMDSGPASKGNDIEPQFLPNGDILFSSTRATRTRSVEGADTAGSLGAAFSPTIEATNSESHAFNLHAMTETGRGNDIRQLTYNMSDDLYPTVIRYIPGLAGRILFTRWEHYPGPGATQQHNQMSLYTMNPDGTDVQLLYGTHSHNTGTNNSAIQFVHPHETANGDVAVLAMSFTGTFDGGDPTLINVSQYVDNTIPLDASSGLVGPAQISTSQGLVVTSPGFSIKGRYSSVVPLLDGTNRAVVSFSLCFANVTDTTTNTTTTVPCTQTGLDLSTATEAPPRYGIFIYHMNDGSVQAITPPMPDTYYTDVAVAQDIIAAKSIPNTVDESDTASQIGTLDIRSIYDLDGAFDDSLLQFPDATTKTNFDALCSGVADQTACGQLKIQYIADPRNATGDTAVFPSKIGRKPQFLRIVKGMYLPDDTTYNFDPNAIGIYRNQLMRQIIGYAPIDPDGSVHVEVPANVPLSISLVDKDGRRISNRHNFWLTLRPGEALSCTGCHDANSTTPHGRTAARSPSINAGAFGSGFPGTDPALYLSGSGYTVSVGETMAQVRSSGPPVNGFDQSKPSVDIEFTDIWTNPADRTPDSSYSYEYASLSTTSPANSSCTSWSEKCRVTINYQDSIQPLWSTKSFVDDSAVMQTCISCHAPDGTNSPAANLDLRPEKLNPNDNYLVSYVNLLSQHAQENPDGTIKTVTVVNADGTTSDVPVTAPGVMTPGSAASNTSSTFFNKFSTACPGPTVHCTAGTPWLNASELKLLSEWLDIGAQYYNNPFLAPMQ